MKKVNKIIIGIVAIVAFIVIGSIGKSNNEVKVIINKAKEYLNNGEISEAENVLRAKAGATNNREFKKLWSIAYGYEQVSNKIKLYDNIDWAEETLDKIDKSYKDYEATREKIDNLKEELSDVKNTREEFKEKIEDVKKLIDEGNYEEAIELSQETPEWQKVNQKDKNTMMELDNQARDLYYEQKKGEKEEEKNRQDEEFTVEKAIEYAEDYSLRTGLDTLRVEVDETPQYDEEGRKYYNVGVYIIELDELNDAYRVYSDGKIRRLD
ncbi:TPA: Tar ligand binding domain-containing protein [Clostridium perfringens]|uniref:Tar ligand binding domain-containing protein n=1 Tax=Clostridium perfringens TaxID=1502 RepID=UPI0013E2DEAE|nr:Tar ligand binding domain-containing protein [Clostridium perfringens]NGT26542.1 hypothetical protein [Clostridium perfringens]